MGDIGLLEIGAGYLCLGARQKQGVVFRATYYLSIRNLQNCAMALSFLIPASVLPLGVGRAFIFT